MSTATLTEKKESSETEQLEKAATESGHDLTSASFTNAETESARPRPAMYD